MAKPSIKLMLGALMCLTLHVSAQETKADFVPSLGVNYGSYPVAKSGEAPLVRLSSPEAQASVVSARDLHGDSRELDNSGWFVFLSLWAAVLAGIGGILWLNRMPQRRS